MGAATSAPAVSRALEDAIEALGGEHSKDVSELVDVFERTEGRKEDTGPAGVDLGVSARDIADSSRRRLKDATELGDVFELPDAVAAALFHRILAVNSSSSGDDDTSTGDDDVAASTPSEISLADCVVYLAVCKTKPGAALEEADALFRRGCTLADLAKVAMVDDDDDEDGARGPFLATLSRNLARSATKLTKKFPGLAAAVPALLLPSTRAHLAPVLCDPRGRGASPILTRAGAWLLAGTLPPERRREWTRIYTSDGGDGRSFVTFCARVTASNGPTLVCVRTRGGCVLGGYVSVDAASTMRSDRADFQGDAACFVWSFGKMTKIENVSTTDESPAGVYKSTGLNDHHVWCANGFTSDRFPNGLGFGGRVGHHALWIDADLERGHCRAGVSTFGNRRLISDEAAEGGRHQGLFDGGAGEFEVDAMEAWAVTPAATEAEPSGGRNKGNGGSGSRKGGGVHAVGGWEARMMLDLVSNANGPARETR